MSGRRVEFLNFGSALRDPLIATDGLPFLLQQKCLLDDLFKEKKVQRIEVLQGALPQSMSA